MLAFQPRTRFHRKCQPPLRLDEEAGFAQPRQPIPVVLARDEELGLHDHHHHYNHGRSEHEGEEDNGRDDVLPPPPPAYGLWRNSVVRVILVLPPYLLRIKLAFKGIKIKGSC